jgi:ParB family transcriptional regulator, chromosome partitioning protein
MNIVEINPFRCKVWNLHSRLEENITEENCRAEIESFERDGQLLPVLGRRLRSGGTHDIELIFGARRLFVAKCLNVPLRVELRSISDRDGIIAMDLENRLRKDICPYERGTSYQRWLQSGHFRSQNDLAQSLHLSPSRLSRLLTVARLPTQIVEAFASVADVREEWGSKLFAAMCNDQAKQAVLRTAQEVAAESPRPPALEIWRRLMSSTKADLSEHDRPGIERVRNEGGKELFRISRQKDSVLFVLPLTLVSEATLRSIEAATRAIMQKARKQPKREIQSNLASGPRFIQERVLDAALA